MTTESKQKYEALYNRINECTEKILKLDDSKQAWILFGLIGAMRGTCLINTWSQVNKDGCESFTEWLENNYKEVIGEL